MMCTTMIDLNFVRLLSCKVQLDFRVMTVPYPDAFLCSNQIYEREHLRMVCKCSFVSVNYSNLEEP